MHQRQAIREAAKAKLEAASIVPTGRVQETRMTPWRETLLPAIAVYALEETSERSMEAPREIQHDLKLEIVGALEATANVDDDLDDLSEKIEQAMDRDPYLAGAASDSWLESTDIAIDTGGQKPIGFVALVYSVRYYSYAPDDSGSPVDLQTVEVETAVNGADDADAAYDSLTELDE